jgi:Mlc titration factor MtfA (ptsG expression regulator)
MLCCVEPNSTKVKNQQLQLWTAELHPTPPIYRDLTPEQRRRLVEQLARLILNQVRDNYPKLPSPTTHHER